MGIAQYEALDPWIGTKVGDDWLRRIGPAHLSYINFLGTLKFSVERYADRLMQRGTLDEKPPRR